MWKLDTQNNEKSKGIKKRNSLIIYKNQNIPLNVPEGTPRMVCVLHIIRRDQIVESVIAVIICFLNQSREALK